MRNSTDFILRYNKQVYAAEAAPWEGSCIWIVKQQIFLSAKRSIFQVFYVKQSCARALNLICILHEPDHRPMAMSMWFNKYIESSEMAYFDFEVQNNMLFSKYINHTWKAEGCRVGPGLCKKPCMCQDKAPKKPGSTHPEGHTQVSCLPGTRMHWSRQN